MVPRACRWAPIRPGPYTMSAFDNLGFNLRLSDIQSAVGIAQMGKLDGLLVERRRIALSYTDMLSPPADSSARPTIRDTHTSRMSFASSGDRARRNAVMDELQQHNIQTRPGTHAVHRLGYYARKYSSVPEQFPNACLAEDTSITLPIFPGMRADQQQFVVKCLNESL